MFDVDNKIRCVVDDQMEAVFDAIVGLAKKRCEGIPLFADQVADETVTDVLMWIVGQVNRIPEQEGYKPPSEKWLREMAKKEDGKCISVGGLAVELGLYKKQGLEGWNNYEGNGCPTDRSKEVEVMLRNGEQFVDFAGLVSWNNNPKFPSHDITHWRLAEVSDVQDR